MKRKELITSKEYVQASIQLNLLNLIEKYMEKKKLKRIELSKELKVSKGYVSQVLNGSYDHKISKLVDLSCNAMPLLFFVDLNKFVEDDANDKIYEIMPMQRPKAITYVEFESKNINLSNKKYPYIKFDSQVDKI